MSQGRSTSLFHASQQWSRMLAEDVKTRFESQFSRIYCQQFSVGLSSGAFGGKDSSVRLSGIVSFLDWCHPA
jgi:hypothetical protein